MCDSCRGVPYSHRGDFQNSRYRALLDLFKNVRPVLHEHLHDELHTYLEPGEEHVTEFSLGAPIDDDRLLRFLRERLGEHRVGRSVRTGRVDYGVTETWTRAEFFPSGRVRLWGASDEDWERVIDQVAWALSESGCIADEDWVRVNGEGVWRFLGSECEII